MIASAPSCRLPSARIFSSQPSRTTCRAESRGTVGSGWLLGGVQPWGRLKYWGVKIKVAITAVLTAGVLFVLVPRLGAAAAAPAMEASTDPQRLLLVIAPAVASSLLVLSVVLAVFKPGWRLRSQPSE